MAKSAAKHVRDVLREGDNRTGSRVPTPRFLAVDDIDSVWLDEPTGRLQRNVRAIMPPDVVAAVQSGFICLRCYEPQSAAFPLVCEFPYCGYPMKDRQILDFAMEFEGKEHVGPAKPISEYLLEQEERVEKRKFEDKIAEGSRGGIVIPRDIRG